MISEEANLKFVENLRLLGHVEEAEALAATTKYAAGMHDAFVQFQLAVGRMPIMDKNTFLQLAVGHGVWNAYQQMADLV